MCANIELKIFKKGFMSALSHYQHATHIFNSKIKKELNFSGLLLANFIAIKLDKCPTNPNYNKDIYMTITL